MALALLPGILLVWLAFRAGGFFAGTPAALVVGLLGLLVGRMTLAERPFAGLSRPLAVAVAALTLLAVWALASGGRSGSAARAILQFDLIFLYALGLVVFGAVTWTPERLRWMCRGIAGGIVAVCTVALITRVLPDLWPIEPNLASDRLSYPLTYWNSLGLLASLGGIFAFHLSCSEREPSVVRVAATAALPLLGATVLLSLSRGAIAAAAIGLVVYMAAGRPRLLLPGLLAGLPPTAVAVVAAYNADLLTKPNPTGEAAVAQGHRAAWFIGLCVAWAAVARLALLAADRRLARRKPARSRRWLATLAGAAAVGLLALVALGAPGYLERQYDRFVHTRVPDQSQDLRSRLTDPASSGRIDAWRVAWEGFADHPLAGNGAGVYRLQWERERPIPLTATNAHSVYLETLDELGLIGLALLLIGLGTILAGLALRIRGDDSGLYAMLLAAATAWAIAAGIDWHWNMPVVTFWLFAAGGAALARREMVDPAEGETARALPAALWRPATGPRVVIGIALLVLAIMPLRVALSQGQLNKSVRAYLEGDCATAIDHGLSSASALNQRPEPFEVIGYCDVRIGRPDLALPMMQSAVGRDPGNWEMRYGLAIARAAQGLDPRPDLAEAARLNPLNQLLAEIRPRFEADRPVVWIREAARAPGLPGLTRLSQ
jgi:hypothetical protein